MRINFKQEELVENLMNAIKARFPEVRLIDITESREDPETLRLNITAPDDDDTKMSLVSFACDKATDIFWIMVTIFWSCQPEQESESGSNRNSRG